MIPNVTILFICQNLCCTTVCISVVVDLEGLNFQCSTKLFSKVQSLNLAQNPQLRLYFVVRSYFIYRS